MGRGLNLGVPGSVLRSEFGSLGPSSNSVLRSRSEFARSELGANSDLDLRSRSELDSDLDLRSRAELSWISAKSQVQV